MYMDYWQSKVIITEELFNIAHNYKAENLRSHLNTVVFVEGKHTGYQESEQIESKKFDDGQNLVKTTLDEKWCYVSAFAKTLDGHLCMITE